MLRTYRRHRAATAPPPPPAAPLLGAAPCSALLLDAQAALLSLCLCCVQVQAESGLPGMAGRPAGSARRVGQRVCGSPQEGIHQQVWGWLFQLLVVGLNLPQGAALPFCAVESPPTAASERRWPATQQHLRLPPRPPPAGACASTSTCRRLKRWGPILPPTAATAASCTCATWMQPLHRWGGRTAAPMRACSSSA